MVRIWESFGPFFFLLFQSVFFFLLLSFLGNQKLYMQCRALKIPPNIEFGILNQKEFNQLVVPQSHRSLCFRCAVLHVFGSFLYRMHVNRLDSAQHMRVPHEPHTHQDTDWIRTANAQFLCE